MKPGTCDDRNQRGDEARLLSFRFNDVEKLTLSKQTGIKNKKQKLNRHPKPASQKVETRNLRLSARASNKTKIGADFHSFGGKIISHLR